MGNAVSDAWDGLGDAVNWVRGAVGDVAEWTFDNMPGGELLADAGGVFADVVLASVKVGGAVMDEVA